MSNLAALVVDEKITDILSHYPAHPHQKAFASDLLRQKLAAYVLSRLPALYTTLDERQACSMHSPGGCYTAEQHSQMAQLIHRGIQHLLAQPPAGVSQVRETAMAPSSWFG
ncbi:MAG: late competence development ComFB family protein [Leptolyngbya sp. RL_3_1]|nr:late competence development ComFB family protein [Leptolyngbya sp. RL_3_1]